VVKSYLNAARTLWWNAKWNPGTNLLKFYVILGKTLGENLWEVQHENAWNPSWNRMGNPTVNMKIPQYMNFFLLMGTILALLYPDLHWPSFVCILSIPREAKSAVFITRAPYLSPCSVQSSKCPPKWDPSSRGCRPNRKVIYRYRYPTQLTRWWAGGSVAEP
jgi:hypothetical protein